MRRFLLPLLAALALPTAVNANVDPKVAEMCMKAVDFQGCVAAMTGKKPNEYEETTRESIRDDGNKLIFNPKAVTAIKEKGEYGRYINFRYVLIYADGSGSREWSVDADCKDYTANWKDHLKQHQYLFENAPQIINQTINHTIDIRGTPCYRMPTDTFDATTCINTYWILVILVPFCSP